MSKALDSGKSLAEAVLAKLPENLRDAARTALLAPEATDALTLLGDSALARSDYSKNMDEIRTKAEELREQEATLVADHARLSDWYAGKKAVIDKYPTLDAIEAELARARGGTPPPADPNPPKPPVSGISKEDLEAAFMERDKGYASVLALTTTLATKHLRDFNEVLDVNALVAHATKNRLPLYDPRADMDAYRALHGEQLKAKQDADEQTRINKLVDEKLAARLKDANQPFPLRNSSPSVLDVLQDPNFKPTDFGVDAAVAEYDRLTANRG